VGVESLSDSGDERITDEPGHQSVRHEEDEHHEEPFQEEIEAVRPLSPARPRRRHREEFMDDNVSIESPPRMVEELVAAGTQPRTHLDEVIDEVVNAPSRSCTCQR
jgi:hypothetical protein